MRRSKRQIAEDRLAVVAAESKTSILQTRLDKIKRARNKLDVLEPGNQKKRKSPKVENKDEDGL